MPNKAVSDYMREMQRRSAGSRWSELSPEQRSAKMKAIRAALASIGGSVKRVQPAWLNEYRTP